MKILIINIHVNYSKSLKFILENNFAVSSIKISRDFRKLNKEEILFPDIIFMEMNLENITFWEKFTQTNYIIQTKIVALTDNTENKFLIKAIKLGISSIINKSEKAEYFVEEVKLVLRGKGSFPVNVISKMQNTIELEKPSISNLFLSVLSRYYKTRNQKAINKH